MISIKQLFVCVLALGLFVVAPRTLLACSNKKVTPKGKGIEVTRCYESKKKKVLSEIETRKDGALHGESASFHRRTGKKTYSSMYKNNVPHGIEKIFDSSGSGELVMVRFNKDGDRDGIKVDYFRADKGGKARMVTVYSKGKEIGPTRYYFDHKGGIKSLIYKNGQMHKSDETRLEFYETGDIRSIDMNYYKPSKSLRIQYYVDGKPFKVNCQPPKQSNLHTMSECRKFFKFDIRNLQKALKIPEKHKKYPTI